MTLMEINLTICLHVSKMLQETKRISLMMTSLPWCQMKFSSHKKFGKLEMYRLHVECLAFLLQQSNSLIQMKAPEEPDPLATMPKKEGVSLEDTNIDGSVKSAKNGESSAASVSINMRNKVEAQIT